MLFRTVILTALVAFGNANPVSPTYDTIIVGMGAAGCAAAGALTRAGRRVLALEAQDRVGGRVHSVPLENGVVELGAEWIHGSEHSRTYELAMQNNITILPQGMALQVFRSDGSKSDGALLKELVNFALEVVEERPEKPEPLGQYLTTRLMDYIRTKHPTLLEDKDFIDQFLHLMDLIIDTYESSNSWNDVTTHDNSETLGGNQYLSWHSYGYKTLFEILLNTYNNGPGLPNLDIKVQKVVTKISYPEQPAQDVVVTCEDGSVYKARNVIVTVSLGVLKERHQSLFLPQLPSAKVEAIENISFGVAGKVIFNFDHIWWDPNIATYGFLWKDEDRKQVPYEDRWLLTVDGISQIMGCNTSLSLWTIGDGTRQSLFSPPLPSAKVESIENIAFGTVGKVILNFNQVWWDPNIEYYALLWKGDDRKQIPYEDRWLLTSEGVLQTMGCNTSISIWTTGDGTRQAETLSDDEVKSKVMSLVRKFLGKDRTIPEPIDMLRSKWYTNPYTRGTYSFDNLATPQHPTARATLAAPLVDSSGAPRVLFAGEATDPKHFSTVHGATDTGVREAARLLPKGN